MNYNTIGGNGTISYSSVVIKHLRWIGFCCVSKNGNFTNVYIGDGSRLGGILYNPLQVNELVKDPEGEVEHSEPNPDKEPVVIEPNTDMDGNMNDDMGDGGDNMDD